MKRVILRSYSNRRTHCMDRFNDVPRILPLNAASDHSAAISQLRDIFFLTSSRKEFASEEDRERFFKHWTSYYLTDCPEETLLALDGSQRVTGYLTGCRNSQKAISRLQSPSLELFIDQL